MSGPIKGLTQDLKIRLNAVFFNGEKLENFGKYIKTEEKNLITKPLANKGAFKNNVDRRGEWVVSQMSTQVNKS